MADRSQMDHLIDGLVSAENLLEHEPDPGSGAEESLVAALGQTYGDDQRLGQIGECVLVAAADGLSAWFYGKPPKGTSHRDLVTLVEEAGIVFGVMPNRIQQVLPRRDRDSGRRRVGAKVVADAATTEKVIIARGEAPVPPAAAVVQDLIPMPAAADMQGLLTALEGKGSSALRRLKVRVPFVRRGDTLSRIQKQPGRAGKSIFGDPIEPEAPPSVVLDVGDGAHLSEDGLCCVASIHGYAGRHHDALRVLEPIWVSGDLMAAYWVGIRQADAVVPPTVQVMQECMESTGVVEGIDDEAIQQLSVNLAHHATSVTLDQVACGKDAVTGTGGEWTHPCAAEETGYVREVKRVLQRARRQEFVDTYAKGLSVQMVKSGECVAKKQKPTEGETGIDVFGEEFMPPEPAAVELSAGDHVVMSSDGLQMTAEIFGILHVDDREVHVVSPLWIEPTHRAAYYLNLPALGPPVVPSEDEVLALLSQVQICYGVDHRSVGALCEKLAQGIPVPLTACIAEGKAPTPGENARFELAFDLSPHGSVFREDGSVDFRELSLTPLIGAGDVIGCHIPATAGKSGIDLFQQTIHTSDGRDLVVDVGVNVTMTQGDGGVEYLRSEIEGELTFADHRGQRTPKIFVAVHETLTVDGDVDFHTGNIDYPGNVHVRGTVCSGFHVCAEGSITIEQTVENGAELKAGGNVLVGFGITGVETKVRAGGSVYAKFVAGADVLAGGDVVVCEYLRDSTVKADHQIAVSGRAGSKMSGMILGGLTIAGNRICARSAGVDGSAVTNLIAGSQPSMLRQVAELNRTITQCEEIRRKTLASLGGKKVDPQRLRGMLCAMLSRASGERRAVLARAVKGLMALQTKLTDAVRDRQSVQQAMRVTTGQARIEISGRVAPSVVVRIGDQSLRMRDQKLDVVDVTFCLGTAKSGESHLRITSN